MWQFLLLSDIARNGDIASTRHDSAEIIELKRGLCSVVKFTFTIIFSSRGSWKIERKTESFRFSIIMNWLIQLTSGPHIGLRQSIALSTSSTWISHVFIFDALLIVPYLFCYVCHLIQWKLHICRVYIIIRRKRQRKDTKNLFGRISPWKCFSFLQLTCRHCNIQIRTINF